MEHNLILTGTCAEIAQADPGLAADAAAYANRARSSATERSYSCDWRDWSRWCRERGAVPIPSSPEAVGLYLADLARNGRKVATIAHRLVAIAQAHRVAGVPLDTKHPAIREVLAGIRRTHGTHKLAKAALLTADIRRCLAVMPRSLIGTRDRAVLLLLFAGALRRSELVALEVADLSISSRRVAITIKRSKTDQAGAGATIGVPRGKRETCPVKALERWLAAAGIAEGRVFRSVDRHGRTGAAMAGAAVAGVVKRAVERIGLDPAQYSGHSGRSGFITSAMLAGADMGGIGLHARQRSIATTRAYVQAAGLLNNPAAGSIGL